ncbi:MAG: NYN domain-containing protein [Solirubrobacterales bacterium]
MAERLIVDGMNVLGSRPDGWWRDRAAAMERMTRRLAGFAAREGIALAVVWDGREHARVARAGAGIEVRFAPGGPDAADREIARMIRADPDPGAITAVSSDRRLRNSVKAAGAAGIGAGELLRRLEASEGVAGVAGAEGAAGADEGSPAE